MKIRVPVYLRTLMALIGFVSIVLFFIRESERRRSYFADRCRYHTIRSMSIIYGDEAQAKRIMDFAEYHSKLVEKYRFAQRYPFLPVRPDPVEPIAP